MTDNVICQKLVKSVLGKDVLKSDVHGETLYFLINQNSVLRSLAILNSDKDLNFSALTDCFAVDFLQTKKYFEIYYQLHSYKINKSIFLYAKVLNSDKVQSVTILFENANWYEREIFDMFGIEFIDHPNLKRILSVHSNNKFTLLKS